MNAGGGFVVGGGEIANNFCMKFLSFFLNYVVFNILGKNKIKKLPPLLHTHHDLCPGRARVTSLQEKMNHPDNVKKNLKILLNY